MGGSNDGRVQPPSNACLFFKNMLITSFSILLFVAFYDRFDRTKQTFLRLHTQIVGTYPRVEPSPCSLPVPSTVELAYGIGRYTRTPWESDPTEAEVYKHIQSSVCGTSTIYELLHKFSGNDTVINEVELVKHLCVGGYDTKTDTYGDMRLRIARAYMHSNAAFVRLATGCWVTSTSYPFRAATCSQLTADMIQAEINAAAQDTLVAGQADASTYPETGNMLFRLLILAAVAHADREINNDVCFGNTLAVNASLFCSNTYDERIGFTTLFDATVSPPPAAAAVADTRAPGYEIVMQRYGQTCASGNALLSDPPSPPPIPSYLYYTDDYSSADPAKLACTHALTWGLLDQRRLFGVPDPRQEFAVDTNWAPALSSLLYNAIGLGRLKDAWSDRSNDFATRLLQYAAYRLGATTQLCTLTGLAVGYFIGWATVPLAVFLVSRLLKIENVTTGLIEPMVRPPPGFAFYFACFLGLAATSWALFVEPPRHPSTHYVDSDCTKWDELSHANPWKTTDAEAGSTDIFIGFIPGAISIYALIYMWRIRGGKCQRSVKRRMPKLRRIFDTRPSEETIIILPQLVLVIFLVLGAGDSGGDWFDEAIVPKLTKAIGLTQAQLVADDCLVLAVSAFFIGYTIGGLCDRWVVTQQELLTFKIPYIIVVGGSAFFPLIFQATLVLTNPTSGSDRQFYFYGSIVCQGITGVLLLRSFSVLASGPAVGQDEAIDEAEVGDLIEYGPQEKPYGYQDDSYEQDLDDYYSQVDPSLARIGRRGAIPASFKIRLSTRAQTAKVREQLPLLRLAV